MPRGFVILAMVAMLLAAAGLMLWQWAAARQTRKLAAKHLDQQMKERIVQEQAAFDIRRARNATIPLSGDPWAAAAAAEIASTPVRKGLDRIPLPAWLQGVVSIQMLTLGVVVGLALSGLVLNFLGFAAAAVLLTLLVLLGVFGIWLHKQKLHRKLVKQLPGFIDSMVRLITVGNSMHAAFTLSVATAKVPLRGHLESASGLVRAGVELDQALNQTARNLDIEEMHLLASILGLGVRYGGRADVLLERVAAFMRDREQAEEELIAMSSETRISAWILGLLPIGVATVIVLLNPGYFNRMLSDGAGIKLIWCSLGLQTVGGFLLYRLARLG